MVTNRPTGANQIDTSVQQQITQVLQIEAQAILAAASLVDDQVSIAIDLLFQCRGRVIVTGMGKMGCVARKVTATFCSTGTPAVFLHPVDAVHGDLGIVSEKDVLLVLSHSGETREILELLPYIARLGMPAIGITAQRNNSLALRCTALLVTGVTREADEIAAAPTNSTTVTLALCDALAIALMRRRGFTETQFAIFHPGGHLGSKLLVKVSDVMHAGDRIPRATGDQTLREGVTIMSQKGVGAVFVVDSAAQVIGVLTDGDLRRIIEHAGDQQATDLLSQRLIDTMNANPRMISDASLAAEALRLMEDNGITVLPVVNQQSQLAGVVHLHDLIRAGLA